MNINNFSSFSVLFSCFMGAFFSVLKFTHAVDIILFFLMTAFCINIILKFGISMIVRYTDIKREKHFSNDYDDHLEEVRIHVNKLEKESHNRIARIHSLEVDKLLNKKK